MYLTVRIASANFQLWCRFVRALDLFKSLGIVFWIGVTLNLIDMPLMGDIKDILKALLQLLSLFSTFDFICNKLVKYSNLNLKGVIMDKLNVWCAWLLRLQGSVKYF